MYSTYIKVVGGLFVCLFVVGCQVAPINPEKWMEREKNACLPTAIAFKEGLNKYGVWSEVVRYSYKNEKGKRVGHAIVAYLYPTGKNQLWTYDYEGSWRTRAYVDNPIQISQQAENIRGRWENTVDYAEFLK